MLSCMFVTPIMALIFMTFTTEKWKKQDWKDFQSISAIMDNIDDVYNMVKIDYMDKTDS